MLNKIIHDSKKFICRVLLAGLAIISSCSTSPVSYAQSSQTGAVSQDNFYQIEDFSEGLKSHVSEYLIDKGSASVAENVRTNSVYGSIAKRDKMLQLSSCRSSAVKSLYRYYKSDATKYTIQTSSSYMDSIADGSGSCTNLATGLSDGKRWTWVTYKDIAIGSNGTDLPKKWDGKTQTTANTDASRTAGDLIADLGAPFAEQNTGSNLDASSWYQYKIAFFNGTSYSYSTARSNPIQTGSSVRDITLTDIPIGPEDTTSRIIYRTEGKASRSAVLAETNFYKVATIADNRTRTYNDAITDVTILADAAPTWATVSGGTNVSPPHGKFLTIHKDRLFIANDPSGVESGKSTLYWSSSLNPDYFDTASDYEVIRPDDGDQITGLLSILSQLYITKENSWTKFYTDSATTTEWTLSSLWSTVGCVAPYSLVSTPIGAIFLGRYGLYSFNGQTPELISDSITDKIRDILATNLNEVVGAYHDNQYLIAYTSTSSGSGFNDRVGVLDIVRKSYVIDTKNIDSWAKFESGTDYGTLYSGSSSTDGKVYAHSGSFSDLVYRYKSQFDEVTPDSVVVRGTEDDPYLTLGWDKTWTSVTGAWSGQGSKTWLVKSLSGTWTSPAIQINANTLDKIYWNESLGFYGDITFAIKTASTEGGLSGASWSSEFSNPSGSDISGLTADDWIQIRATLSSSVYTEIPELYLEDSFVFHLTYQREGTTGESSIFSLWKSGFTDMGGSENPKRIKEIQVFYEGTEGTLTFGYENDTGTTYSFDINLATSPTASTTDYYFGNSTEKIYTHFPRVDNTPIGRKWRFSLTENGTVGWKVNRIVVRFDNNAYVTYK